MCSLGIEPTTICAANAMLYHWATGTWIETRQHLRACIWRARATNTVSFTRSFDSRLARRRSLERASETSPIWCGHKDILHLNKRNPFREKETEEAVVNGVANPTPCINCGKYFSRVNQKKWIAYVNMLILTPLVKINWYCSALTL